MGTTTRKSKKCPYLFVTWNVRTLFDREVNRPPRRTALVTTELHRHNIDIAALCETRLADEGSLIEVGEGYIGLYF